MLDGLITNTEIEKVLGLTTQQIDSLRQKGLKGFRAGRGKWIFLERDVIEFFEKNIGKVTDGKN